MKEYKYKLEMVYTEAILISIVLTLLYFTREIDNIRFLLIFGVIYLFYRIAIALYGICSVSLGENELRIKYLHPLKKEWKINYEDVESYAPIKMTKKKNSKVFMAVINPKVGKSQILWDKGIEDFQELNEILSSALPKPITEQNGGDNPKICDST